MTPLAMKVANELTLPKAKRTFDDTAHVMDLLDKDMHCFEVSAISKSVNDVMGDCADGDSVDESWTVWRDIETILPRLFLPSPVTWLEHVFYGHRVACVLRENEGVFTLITVHDGPNGGCSIPMCKFRARDILERGDDRIEITNLYEEEDEGFIPDPIYPGFDLDKLNPKDATPANIAAAEMRVSWLNGRVETLTKKSVRVRATADFLGAANRFIGMCVLTLDLINTPGLIGLCSHDPHRGMARKLAGLRGGSYPLQAWSEVVLKHQTVIAGNEERLTGSTFHKCLHFVRSHLRHYRDGHVTVIPAHWRGDPALGIKRTRYRMAA